MISVTLRPVTLRLLTAISVSSLVPGVSSANCCPAAIISLFGGQQPNPPLLQNDYYQNFLGLRSGPRFAAPLPQAPLPQPEQNAGDASSSTVLEKKVLVRTLGGTEEMELRVMGGKEIITGGYIRTLVAERSGLKVEDVINLIDERSGEVVQDHDRVDFRHYLFTPTFSVIIDNSPWQTKLIRGLPSVLSGMKRWFGLVGEPVRAGRNFYVEEILIKWVKKQGGGRHWNFSSISGGNPREVTMIVTPPKGKKDQFGTAKEPGYKLSFSWDFEDHESGLRDSFEYRVGLVFDEEPLLDSSAFFPATTWEDIKDTHDAFSCSEAHPDNIRLLEVPVDPQTIPDDTPMNRIFLRESSQGQITFQYN